MSNRSQPWWDAKSKAHKDRSQLDTLLFNLSKRKSSKKKAKKK